MTKVDSPLAARPIPTIRMSVLVVLVAASLAISAQAQEYVGGHIGFVLPLVTHAGGQTSTISDNFTIGFPTGVTVKGTGRLAYDLELVPAIQDSPRKVSLTVVLDSSGRSGITGLPEGGWLLTSTRHNLGSRR
jgi:hypothetical protein